ncbi:MAG: prenyltransferase [Lentisphaeria bacterium]
MTVISVTIGSTWALPNAWSWPLYGMALFTMLTLHGGANLFNDYFDFKNGVDLPDVPRVKCHPHALVRGNLTPRQVRTLAIALYACGTVSGISLAIICGWPVLLLVALGSFLGFFYTAKPVALKYYGIGEMVAFLIWGPLGMSAAYFVQARHFSYPLLPTSVPFGILVSLTLLANNLRDLEYDRRQNIQTLAVLLGPTAGKKLFGWLLFLVFSGTALMSFTGPLSPWSLLTLPALLLAVPLYKVMLHEIPPDADARTGQLDFVFGGLFAISIILQKLVYNNFS